MLFHNNFLIGLIKIYIIREFIFSWFFFVWNAQRKCGKIYFLYINMRLFIESYKYGLFLQQCVCASIT